ncbi:MAG TPA: DUF1080 domain-containing protein [bacterium]|nr:DUF1080 domain-containing protein [bacterium]
MRTTCVTLGSLVLLAGCSGLYQVTPTAGAIGFEGAMTGWRTASTGGDGPHATWQRRADDDAVSPPNVLSVTATNHTSESRFNLYWSDQERFRDGVLSVAVRADDGVVDQGGGPMWRVQDENNYYVCRFNPLELNYRVYVVANGVRRQLATAIVDVTAGRWHRIEVAHHGDHVVCWLDGRRLLDVHDATITQPGGVGLWTKADARTSFDDFVVSAK